MEPFHLHFKGIEGTNILSFTQLSLLSCCNYASCRARAFNDSKIVMNQVMIIF